MTETEVAAVLVGIAFGCLVTWGLELMVKRSRR